jgi:excisionase family DNA binding protein
VVAGTIPADGDEIQLMNSPLAYSIAEACAAARAGRTAVYQAIKDGELIARKRGRRTIILSDDLRRWLDRLPAVVRKTNP